MEKPLQQTVEERRAYVDQIRSSFKTENSTPVSHYSSYGTMPEQTEEEPASSTIGIRTIIAVLIFAAFVYCDKEKITYQDYSTQEVFSQIEWNPLPIDEIMKTAETSQP